MLMPNKGPRKLTKTINEGRVPSDMVNNFRKKKVFSALSALAALLMLVRAVYIEPKQVKAIIARRMMKRQLFT
jgi:hypothetical protein